MAGMPPSAATPPCRGLSPISWCGSSGSTRRCCRSCALAWASANCAKMANRTLPRTDRAIDRFSGCASSTTALLLLEDIGSRLAVADQMVGEEVPQALREIRLIVGIRVPLARQNEHVEALVRLD